MYIQNTEDTFFFLIFFPFPNYRLVEHLLYFSIFSLAIQNSISCNLFKISRLLHGIKKSDFFYWDFFF